MAGRFREGAGPGDVHAPPPPTHTPPFSQVVALDALPPFSQVLALDALPPFSQVLALDALPSSASASDPKPQPHHTELCGALASNDQAVELRRIRASVQDSADKAKEKARSLHEATQKINKYKNIVTRKRQRDGAAASAADKLGPAGGVSSSSSGALRMGAQNNSAVLSNSAIPKIGNVKIGEVKKIVIKKIVRKIQRATDAAFPPSLIPCSQWKKREECIGRGAVGNVYLGYNSEHDQFCAIKEVLLVLNDRKSREILNQMNQEILVLKQLSHPNIVQYYGIIMTDHALSIYMEFVSKGSIHSLLAKNGAFKESMIRSYTAQILSGLAFMHEKRHIHRDIKGANILVGSNNEVKIADFGLTKHIQTLTARHTSVGTPYWMAPEVILSTSSDKGYNLSADIWSLACTVIEMATGKHPLHGFEPIQAMFKIANDTTYIPEIPDVLSDEGKNFLQLCLQRDPASRPSAAQLMNHPFIRNQGS